MSVLRMSVLRRGSEQRRPKTPALEPRRLLLPPSLPLLPPASEPRPKTSEPRTPLLRMLEASEGRRALSTDQRRLLRWLLIVLSPPPSGTCSPASPTTSGVIGASACSPPPFGVSRRAVELGRCCCCCCGRQESASDVIEILRERESRGVDDRRGVSAGAIGAIGGEHADRRSSLRPSEARSRHLDLDLCGAVARQPRMPSAAVSCGGGRRGKNARRERA